MDTRQGDCLPKPLALLQLNKSKECEMSELAVLVGAMSDSKLAELKEEHKDNPSVVASIDEVLELRAKQAEQAQAKVEFERQIQKLVAKLPHPEDINNIFLHWGEVDVKDGEPIDFAIIGEGQVKLASDLTEDELAQNYPIEARTPSHKEYQWIVDVNHVTKVSGGGGNIPKRAISVYKRNGTQLELKGNFGSASKACEALGIVVGGDSAIRVLRREGYFTEAYEGTDLTS